MIRCELGQNQAKQSSAAIHTAWRTPANAFKASNRSPSAGRPKLASIGAFHSIGNAQPLSPDIAASMRIAASKDVARKKVHATVTAMKVNNTLAAFAHQASAQRNPIAVRPTAAVNTADEMIGAALQRAQGMLGGHTVAVSLSDDVLAARCDFTQTQRIIVNLLENAAKYAPAGTSIEVTASRDTKQLFIAVADEGPGVPPGEEERIFEAVHRPPGTSPDIRGTGLGLSIARGLAQAQGGTLTYRARGGVGSIFTLALPVVDAPTEMHAAPSDTGS